MRGKRMWQTLRLYTILDANKRTKYYKEKEIFHSMGDHCLIMDRKVPLYAKLISLGNNVQIASNVHFNTHDVTHLMLNNREKTLGGDNNYPEKTGCIEIGDNVFIGAGTSINYNVKIGSNVIIGACSLITKDVPDNVVVGGIPAKTIGSFEDYLKKRARSTQNDVKPVTECITTDIEKEMWEQFHLSRINGKL